MTATIGGIDWDYFTGLVQPPGEEIKEDPGLGLSTQIKTPGGNVTTWNLVPDEASAVALAGLAGAIVDSSVPVTLGGYTLPIDIYVNGVDFHWRKTAGRAGREWVVEARWAFGNSKSISGGGGSVITQYVHTKVYVGTTIAGLTERPELRAMEVVEAFGADVGSALISMDVVEGEQQPLDIKGQYVRIDLPDDPDTPAVWTPRFLGRIIDRAIVPAEAKGEAYANYPCRDIAGELASPLWRWWERNPDDTVVDPGEWLGANLIPRGDRHTVPLGGLEVSNRGDIQTRVPWRAKDYLDTVFQVVPAQHESDLTWVINGQLTALDNFDQLNPGGGTVLDLLGQVTSSGIGYVRLGTAAAQTLTWKSPLAAAITTPSYTIPANDTPQTLDLTDDTLGIAFNGYSYEESGALVRDQIFVVGGRPHHAITLGFRGDDTLQMVKGWDPADETSWDQAPDLEAANDVRLADVYRRFVLADDWVGATYKDPANTLDINRQTADNATYGKDGEDGEFIAGGSFAYHSVKFTKVLPLTQGQDYTSTSTAETDWSKVQAKPGVFLVSDPGGANEEWQVLEIDVQVDTDQPAVILGRDAQDAALIKAAIDAGQDIVFTIGYQYPVPWRISWRRDPVARPASTTRTAIYTLPDISYEYIHDQTVTGVSEGAPTFSDEGVVGGDKPDDLLHTLQLARVIHEDAQVHVAWTHTSRIDLDPSRDLGVLLTDVTVPAGVGVLTANALITQRKITLSVANLATAYVAYRRFPAYRPTVQYDTQPTANVFWNREVVSL